MVEKENEEKTFWVVVQHLEGPQIKRRGKASGRRNSWSVRIFQKSSRDTTSRLICSSNCDPLCLGPRHVSFIPCWRWDALRPRDTSVEAIGFKKKKSNPGDGYAVHYIVYIFWLPGNLKIGFCMSCKKITSRASKITRTRTIHSCELL